MCDVLGVFLRLIRLGIIGSLRIVLIGIQMLGMLVNERIRGSTLLLMLLESVVRMMLGLVMVKVLPCDMGVLGIGIVLLS